MSIRKTILITGASSGLGGEIARQYAGLGTRLILLGRNPDRLAKIATECRSKGAETHPAHIDVRDKVKMSEYLARICSQYNIDILVASAGVSAGTLEGPESAAQVEVIFDTNVGGMLNVVMPLLPGMIARGKGNIVIISSMAGLLGLSSAPSYSTSKACVRVFGEALRGYLKQYNIAVTVVIPGYIKTPMTAVNNFPMPFIISAERAARKIIKGIEKNKGIIAFPLLTYILLKFFALLPYQLIDYINSKLPGKPAFEE